jgi:hypothetical protein
VRVLVVGHARSATTWIGTALGFTAGSGFVSEPDDASWSPYGIRVLDGEGVYTVLTADDTGSKQWARLWGAAFGEPVRYIRGQRRISDALYWRASDDERFDLLAPGRRIPIRLRAAGALAVPKHLQPGTENHVVKSVLAPFMIDWIRARWDPVVVVCFRHPLDVVASFIDVGLARTTRVGVIDRLSAAARAVGTDRFRVPIPPRDDIVACTAWRAGLVMSVLDEAVAQHPEFRVVNYEDVRPDPVGQLRALAEALGLEWTADTEDFVVRSNRPGVRFEIARVAELQLDRWRTRLTPAEASAASEVLAQFPIAARYAGQLAG